MRAGWLVATALVVCSFGAAFKVAAAQDRAPDPAHEEEARALFEEAIGRLQEGRFADAVELLERSVAAYPSPAAAFNLAVALRGIGDGVAATEWLERLRSGELGDLGASERSDVARLAEEIAAEVAHVSVEVCGGNDVSVRLDGELWARFDGCETLSRPVSVGRHVITVTGAGHLPLEEPLRVAAGDRVERRLLLVAVPVGTLVVRVPNEASEVEVVGAGRGFGGFRRELPPGPYDVRATLPDRGLLERSVTLSPGETLEVDFAADEGGLGLGGWIALVTGLAVATAGAIVLAIVLIEDNRTQQLITDPVFGVSETLRPPLEVRW